MGMGVGAGGDDFREPFATSLTSIVDSDQYQDLHQEYEQEWWPEEKGLEA